MGECRKRRIARQTSQRLSDHHVMVGPHSIMLMPIDPTGNGTSVLYIFDIPSPGDVDILVHEDIDPEAQAEMRRRDFMLEPLL